MFRTTNNALEIIWLTTHFTRYQYAVWRQHGGRQVQPLRHTHAGIEKGATGGSVTFACQIQGVRKITTQMVKRHQSVIGQLADRPDDPGTGRHLLKTTGPAATAGSGPAPNRQMRDLGLVKTSRKTVATRYRRPDPHADIHQ